MKYVLRKFDLRKDIVSIFNMFMNMDEQYLFFPQLNINSDYEFEIWFMNMLKTSIHDFFVVEIKGQTIGFIYSYKYREYDQNCYICLYIDKQYRSFGIGAFVTIEFLSYLFKYYPLHKVFSSVYKYNEESYKNHIDANFQIEGQIKEYRYYNGEFHDMFIFSLSRTQFENRFLPLYGAKKNDKI